jgi:hypothetical protein
MCSSLFIIYLTDSTSKQFDIVYGLKSNTDLRERKLLVRRVRMDECT